jgi:hypothetical protein
VNAIAFADVNKDGKTDLVMGGNQFHFQPQFARLDASYGHVVLNKGNGKWEWIYPAQSGLKLRGEIRNIIRLNSPGKQELLVLQNDDYPVMYKMNY